METVQTSVGPAQVGTIAEFYAEALAGVGPQDRLEYRGQSASWANGRLTLTGAPGSAGAAPGEFELDDLTINGQSLSAFNAQAATNG